MYVAQVIAVTKLTCPFTVCIWMLFVRQLLPAVYKLVRCRWELYHEPDHFIDRADVLSVHTWQHLCAADLTLHEADATVQARISVPDLSRLHASSPRRTGI